MVDESIYSRTVCVSESPYLFGGSVLVSTQPGGKIINIETYASTNCGAANGKDSTTFTAHCACNG